VPKIIIIFMLFSSLLRAQEPVQKTIDPITDLPPYITKITNFGQRADWSHDGKRILFIEKTFGDIYDIILSGARDFENEDPWPSRDQDNAELWILKKDLSGPPIPLGENCSEGPAVSRSKMTIAWTLENAFYMADIVIKNDKPQLTHKMKILDSRDLTFECDLETQNFRPPDEKELLFSAYGYQGSEVMGLNIETGEVINYSNAPDQYDEPEGIFHDGEFITVECDKHNTRGIHFNDIYKLALDGSGKMERLTHFADYKGYKSTNPVISDDGKFMAFQYAKEGDPAGVGRGILIMDLINYEQLKTDK